MRTNAFVSSRSLVVAARAGLIAAVAAVAVGCNSEPKDSVSFNAIKSDLTPEMLTLTQRDVDAERTVAVTENTNWRLFWMDLGRVWGLDRPSMLSPYTIIPTSGNPQ
jgi:hypothetical protein